MDSLLLKLFTHLHSTCVCVCFTSRRNLPADTRRHSRPTALARSPSPPWFLRQPSGGHSPRICIRMALHAAAPACAVFCRLPSPSPSHVGGRRSLPAVASPRGVVSAAPLRTRAGIRCGVRVLCTLTFKIVLRSPLAYLHMLFILLHLAATLSTGIMLLKAIFL